MTERQVIEKEIKKLRSVNERTRDNREKAELRLSRNWTEAEEAKEELDIERLTDAQDKVRTAVLSINRHTKQILNNTNRIIKLEKELGQLCSKASN